MTLIQSKALISLSPFSGQPRCNTVEIGYWLDAFIEIPHPLPDLVMDSATTAAERRSPAGNVPCNINRFSFLIYLFHTPGSRSEKNEVANTSISHYYQPFNIISTHFSSPGSKRQGAFHTHIQYSWDMQPTFNPISVCRAEVGINCRYRMPLTIELPLYWNSFLKSI